MAKTTGKQQQQQELQTEFTLLTNDFNNLKDAVLKSKLEKIDKEIETIESSQLFLEKNATLLNTLNTNKQRALKTRDNTINSSVNYYHSTLYTLDCQLKNDRYKEKYNFIHSLHKKLYNIGYEKYLLESSVFESNRSEGQIQKRKKARKVELDEYLKFVAHGDWPSASIPQISKSDLNEDFEMLGLKRKKAPAVEQVIKQEARNIVSTHELHSPKNTPPKRQRQSIKYLQLPHHHLANNNKQRQEKKPHYQPTTKVVSPPRSVPIQLPQRLPDFDPSQHPPPQGPLSKKLDKQQAKPNLPKASSAHNLSAKTKTSGQRIPLSHSTGSLPTLPSLSSSFPTLPPPTTFYNNSGNSNSSSSSSNHNTSKRTSSTGIYPSQQQHPHHHHLQQQQHPHHHHLQQQQQQQRHYQRAPLPQTQPTTGSSNNTSGQSSSSSSYIQLPAPNTNQRFTSSTTLPPLNNNPTSSSSSSTTTSREGVSSPIPPPPIIVQQTKKTNPKDFKSGDIVHVQDNIYNLRYKAKIVAIHSFEVQMQRMDGSRVRVSCHSFDDGSVVLDLV